MQLFWLVLSIALFVIEAVVPGLVSIWFGFGGIAAMIVSFFSDSIVLQSIVFLAVSALLLLATRRLVKKYMKLGEEKTNADRFIGQDAIVIERIDNLHSTGRVSIYGFEWKASAADSSVIEEGSVVTIRSIKGVTAVVQQKEIQ